MPEETTETIETTEVVENPVTEYADVENFHTLGVYQKLALVRRWALEAGIKKSGYHKYPNFPYYELADIVPFLEESFYKVGLILVIKNLGCAGSWNAEVVDCDHPDWGDGRISFSGVWATPEVIVSNQGKDVGNSTQAVGSGITYFRRYIAMVVLDLVELDTVDADMSAPTRPDAPAVPAKPQRPATPVERKAAAKAITSSAEAPSILLKSLHEAIKRCLRDTSKSDRAIALEAKAKEMTADFTSGKQSDVERLIAAANQLARVAKAKE